MDLGKILVPFTGDKADVEALRLACDLSKKAKRKVYVVYVIEVQRSLPVDAELESELKKGEQMLRQAERIAEEQDYEVETDLLQARQAGPAIVDEAIERGIDTIVMGIEYRKRYGKYTVGSIVPYLFESAPCRLLLYRGAVPPGEEVG